MRFDEKKREELRGRYGVGSNKVVAFVGNVIPVKNVRQAFEAISE